MSSPSPATAGLAELRLLTNAAFGFNVALYERCGYRVTAREAFRGGVAVHMRKPLAGGERPAATKPGRTWPLQAGRPFLPPDGARRPGTDGIGDGPPRRPAPSP